MVLAIGLKKIRIDLEDLPSVTDQICEILRKNGIEDIDKLAATDLGELISLLGDSELVTNLVEEAYVLIEKYGHKFVKGEDLIKEIEDFAILTTGNIVWN